MLPAFLPAPSLPHARPRPLPPALPRRHLRLRPPLCALSIRQLPRRDLLRLSLAVLLLPLPARAVPAVTDRVFFDISIAGTPRGRITLGLYGRLAPTTVDVIKALATATLADKRGRTVGYRYSVAPKVYPAARAVELGRVKQNDPLNQTPGLPARQSVPVEAPAVVEANDLAHDRPGLVSVRRQGGFEFLVSADKRDQWDAEWLVVGEVLDGWDVLNDMVQVPVNRKSTDGFRKVGKAIGDARAKVDLEDKPLQKIQIANCGIL